MIKEKKTKIVATIGPATNNIDMLVKMRQNGMNIARLNFSHSDYDGSISYIENIRKAEKKSGRSIAILQDLSGPKIRTGEFENGETILKKNTIVEISIKDILGNSKIFSINYKKLFKDLKKGHRILLNDGKQELKVLSVGKNLVKARVTIGGFIRSRRGVNLPDSKLSISALTAKDKKDIKFAIDFNVDFVAFSFVKTAEDVKELRNILNKNKSKAMIISKIETPQAIENFDEILKESDGIMVARGDLAVEVEAHRVPKMQKDIIEKCNIAGKPVITATQMMDSMIDSPVPTRAEVSDIYNAISDGTDSIMLSEETAMGKYPLKTVQTMTKIAMEAENSINYDKFIERNYAYKNENVSTVDAITRYTAKTAKDIDAKIIIALTESGATSRMISRYKSKKPIYVFSSSRMSLRQSSISFGTKSGECADFKKVTEVIDFSKK
jgi:pyruvate kinase